jgi:glycosyltransferase involved in cell wall biosynthesis
MRLSFIVSSNGKFHSFSLVQAIENRGLLERFYTVFYSPRDRTLARFIRRQDKEVIPLAKVRTNVLTELPTRLGGRLPVLGQYAEYLKAMWLDRWVAGHLEEERASVFLGWSNSSLRSLERAKAKGMVTIVTRGSSHIQYQNAILGREYAKRGLRYRPPYGIERRELLEYESADYIRIPSSYVRRTFIEHGVSAAKLLQLTYAIDLTHFRPMRRRRAGCFRVLFLNAATVQKGFFYARDAIRAINQGGLPGVEFLFIGDAEPLVRRPLRDLVNMAPNVRAVGRVDQYQLARWISECDVGVFPTIQEGLANTVPQTMACGVPVIATVNSGAEDLIDDGREGFIVPNMDADALMRRIVWCYEHRSVCREMGEAARARVSRRTWDEVVEEMVRRVT